jgi:hypothetical protein
MKERERGYPFSHNVSETHSLKRKNESRRAKTVSLFSLRPPKMRPLVEGTYPVDVAPTLAHLVIDTGSPLIRRLLLTAKKIARTPPRVPRHQSNPILVDDDMTQYVRVEPCRPCKQYSAQVNAPIMAYRTRAACHKIIFNPCRIYLNWEQPHTRQARIP